MSSHFRLPAFYPILDSSALAARECPVLLAAEVLIESGVRILQYRHKDDWTQAHFDEAKKLSLLCQDAGVLFVLNDRADFAKILRTALHIGQNDLSPFAARKLVNDEVIGFSTHNHEQLKCGAEEPVEYLSIGPIFPTTSKLRPDPVVGLEGLSKLRHITTKPLCAIGGITLQNAESVLLAKANSVAIISDIIPAVCNRKSLKERAQAWLSLAGKFNVSP
jgi:thiamine-phosphate pyrophosphorylase